MYTIGGGQNFKFSLITRKCVDILIKIQKCEKLGENHEKMWAYNIKRRENV